MPPPSSSTRMRSTPPFVVAISMRVAPASSAFSTRSFTALARRSTTSPAAMRLSVRSPSLRMQPAAFDSTLVERVVAEAVVRRPPALKLQTGLCGLHVRVVLHQSRGGQVDGDGRAFTLGALDADAAAMQLRERLDDRQPETSALFRTRF